MTDHTKFLVNAFYLTDTARGIESLLNDMEIPASYELLCNPIVNGDRVTLIFHANARTEKDSSMADLLHFAEVIGREIESDDTTKWED